MNDIEAAKGVIFVLSVSTIFLGLVALVLSLILAELVAGRGSAAAAGDTMDDALWRIQRRLRRTVDQSRQAMFEEASRPRSADDAVRRPRPDRHRP